MTRQRGSILLYGLLALAVVTICGRREPSAIAEVIVSAAVVAIVRVSMDLSVIEIWYNFRHENNHR